jgi:hypothetical protein
MGTVLSELIGSLLDRKVSWTDRNGSLQQGILKEIRGETVVVMTQPFGLVTPKRLKLPAADVTLNQADPPHARDQVTHSLKRDASGLWRWEIRIGGEVWKKKRGFRSQRTAHESVVAALPEAESAAENIFPTREAICSTYIWRAEFIRSKLGPADFYNQLNQRRKQICEELAQRLWDGAVARP